MHTLTADLGQRRTAALRTPEGIVLATVGDHQFALVEHMADDVAYLLRHSKLLIQEAPVMDGHVIKHRNAQVFLSVGVIGLDNWRKLLVVTSKERLLAQPREGQGMRQAYLAGFIEHDQAIWRKFLKRRKVKRGGRSSHCCQPRFS